MSYLVLARKYRPQSFQDLVGQEHVSKTLANAIASGRVAHAFLFTGVRGVGKTTSARLLAKCLSCVGPDGQFSGSTATPCQECAPCKEITVGADMDVQEIDAASYNGVDEVRRLQEGLAFRPARDRYKIYIVDEVHMLSNAAWNAFLKTLEEPPPHVKFIFATTEVHKVPVTILSRCQRYDFKLIPTATIAARLKEVLQAESITADDGAVAVLAREAAGSMRDAMSLLDQVIAFSGENLHGEDVARVLGVADRQILHELASALVSGDAAVALSVVDRLAQQGFDLPHVAKDILRHLRNLVVARVCGPSGRELLDLADDELNDVQTLATATDVDDLTRLFQGFSKGYDDIVRSGQPRAALEMTLVRLARRPPLLPLDELLSRLGDLERRLAGNAPPPAPRGGGASSGGSSGGGSGGRMAHGPTSPSISSVSWGSESGERTLGSLALAPQPVAAQPKPETVSHVFVPPPVLKAVPNPVVEPIAERQPAASVVEPPSAPASSVNEVAAPTNLAAWRTILNRVRAAKPALASVLEHAIPIRMEKERVVLGYAERDTFLADQAREPEALALLTQHVRDHFGHPTEVALDLAAGGVRIATVAHINREERRAEVAKARDNAQKHPLVQEVIRLFGAEVREIRLPDGDD